MELPVACGLFLCERIIIEEGTRYVTLVNVFTEREATDFPSDPLACAVYASLVSGRGIIPMKLSVSRLNDLSVVYEKSFTRSRFRLSSWTRWPKSGSCFSLKGWYFPRPDGMSFPWRPADRQLRQPWWRCSRRRSSDGPTAETKPTPSDCGLCVQRRHASQ